MKLHYKVLIIEDDATNSELLRLQLEAQASVARFDVQEETRFRAGLGILTHDSIDLVMLDKKLPDDEDLPTAIKKIREINETVAIYVLSGDVTLREAIRVVKFGGNECRQKPPEAAERLAWSLVVLIEQQRQIVREREAAIEAADEKLDDCLKRLDDTWREKFSAREKELLAEVAEAKRPKRPYYKRGSFWLKVAAFLAAAIATAIIKALKG